MIGTKGPPPRSGEEGQGPYWPEIIAFLDKDFLVFEI
jgi:hypothetical protein